MKNQMKNFAAACAFAAVTISGAVLANYAHAKYTSPIWDMRRTLSMTFGQSRIALEAPMGMCFLDESQYMESAVIKQLRAAGHDSGEGLLMAIFASCDEIEKLAMLPQLTADTMPGVDPPTADMDNRGAITWLAPKLGRAPLGMNEYLDMREASFGDEVKQAIAKGYRKFGASQSIKMSDNVTAKLLSAAPDQYKFDEHSTRTAAGVSISYNSAFVSEYTKHNQFGAVGTTMLRHFPVQVTMIGDGKRGPKTQADMHATMDRYLAQISKLNP